VVRVRSGESGKPARCQVIGLRRMPLWMYWRRCGLLLALVMLVAAHGTPSALAADGLPPGVPVPAWAKGKKIHFEPEEPRKPSHRDGPSAAGRPVAGPTAADAKANPLTSSSPRLRYSGGLVQNEPRLVLVFMGKQWENDLSLRHELEATAESLPGSAYQQILTQYSGLYGPISSPLAGSPVVEKYYDERVIAGGVKGNEAVQEGLELIQRAGAGQDTNATYAVLPAPGTAEPTSGTCGFHEEDGGSGAVASLGPSIAAIMDTGDVPGCQVSKTLTHEYAESVTDAGGDGWNTGEGGDQDIGEDEIADICNSLGPGRLADAAQVAWLWDDSKGACEIEDSDPGSVPIGPYAETSRRNPSLEGATNLTLESEALETSIYPCNLAAHYYFEYGPTEAYGSKTSESVAPATWGAVTVKTTVSGLQHNVPYHWRVVVKTTNGTVDGGDHEFTIPYDVEAREERASNISFSEATLSGEVNPVGVEAHYYFEYGTTEAYGSKTAEAGAGSGSTFAEVTPAVVTGLEPGTLYHFRIVASSARGTTVGEDKEFETLGGKPVVETLLVFNIGYTEALIRGRVGRKGVRTTYHFDYGKTEAYGQQTPEEESERPEEDGEEAVLSGLTPGMLYHYRIVATNSYGTSYGADRTFSTGPEPLVETEAAEAVSYDAVALRGAIDPRGAEIDYYFEYGTTDAYGQHTVEFSAGSGTTSAQETQSVSGLAEDSTYHFRIVAKNSYGTTYGSDRTFSTGVKPSVRTGATATIDPEEATLSGTINPHGTEVSYYFEYGLTPGYGMSTARTSAGSGAIDVEASQRIAALSPNTTYHYRLVAIYGSLQQYGSDATFTTMALASLVEPIGPMSPTTPAALPVNPLVPAPLPSPVSPPRGGPSLQVAQRGNSLSIVLGLSLRAARVEFDATVPSLQLGVTRPKGHRGPFVLARLVRTKVQAGRSKFLLALDMARIRKLGRRHLRLTITVKITPFSGAQQKTFRTLVLV
jgi:hypothetical protein